MAGQIELTGRLTITSPAGEVLTVRGDGESVFIDAPSLKALGRLREMRASPQLRAAVDTVGASRLASIIYLQVRGSTVAVIGPRLTPDPLARLLRLGPIRTRPLGILRAACGLA